MIKKHSLFSFTAEYSGCSNGTSQFSSLQNTSTTIGEPGMDQNSTTPNRWSFDW